MKVQSEAALYDINGNLIVRAQAPTDGPQYHPIELQAGTYYLGIVLSLRKDQDAPEHVPAPFPANPSERFVRRP